MAKAGKFAALADFRQQPTTEDVASEAPIEASPAPAAVESPKGRGRPPGKRSNPEWKLYSHFLKKKTQRKIAAILAERDDGQDLSDILQDMLERWLADQKGKNSHR